MNSVVVTGTRARKMLLEAGNVLSSRIGNEGKLGDMSVTYKQAVFTNRSALSFTGHFDDDSLRRACFKIIQTLPAADSGF